MVDKNVITTALWLRPELVRPWWQICLVTFFMVGYSVIGGAYYISHHASGAYLARITDYALLSLLVREAIFLSPFLVFLKLQGWEKTDFRFGLGVKSSIGGFGLFIALNLAAILVNLSLYYLVRTLWYTPYGPWLYNFVPHTRPATISVHLSWAMIIASSALNGITEELIYMSYVFNQSAQKYGPMVALLLVMMIRSLVHIYQGTEHIVEIMVLSLVFGLWYLKGRKVWPLILAHCLADFSGLASLKGF